MIRIKTAYLLLAGACVLAFAGALGFDFLRCQDDWAYVTGNPNLVLDLPHFIAMVTTPVLGLWTPLPQASYFLDYAIGGFHPEVYRAITLLWHIGVVWLAFRLFRELMIRRNAAFFAALLFAIHPQRVESVVWISERKDVMCAFFFLLGCVLFLTSLRKKRQSLYWFSLVAMLAALGSKPSAVALPAVLVALDFHLRGKLRLKPVLPHIVLAGLFLCGGLLRDTANNFAQEGFRPLVGIRNYCMYFFKTFYPSELYPLYPFVSLTWFDWALIAACSGALVWFWLDRRKQTIRDVLPMLFAAGAVLAPVSGVMIFSNADFADRYSYIPSVFFLAALMMILPAPPERFRKWVWLWPALLLLRTWLYLPNWNGDDAMLSASCSAPKYNFCAAGLYASELVRQGNAKAARTVFLDCGRDDPRTRRSMKYVEVMDRMLELMERYQDGKRAELLPGFTAILTSDANRERLQDLNYCSLIPFMTAFADCAMAAGRPMMASRIYEVLADAYPQEKFTAPFYRGVAMMLRRDHAAAVRYFQAAVEASPSDEIARRNLEAARRLAAQGKP